MCFVLVCKLFHYKDRSKFFLVCALNIFFDFLVETEVTKVRMGYALEEWCLQKRYGQYLHYFNLSARALNRAVLIN